MAGFVYDIQSGKMVRPAAKKRGRRIASAQRGFIQAANPSFLESWASSQKGPNVDLQGSLQTIINRSRDLEENEYGASFFTKWTSGIVGSRGFTLESCPEDSPGVVDKYAKEIIESAWREQKRARNWTTSGDMPYGEAKRLSERTFARDGGVLIKCVKGFPGNERRFAVQYIEIDQIDLQMNRGGGDGRNRIVMGKEIDSFGRVVAYHLYGTHPGEVYGIGDGRKRTRVSAEGIVHRYNRTRFSQFHGVPLVLAAMDNLRHIERAAEAEVIAARMSACSVFALQDNDQGEFSPNTGEGGEDDYYDLELDPERPLWEVPEGKRLDLLSPQHPNSAFPDFLKSVLKGTAAGLGLHYPGLAGDLEGVNYSSLREGKLDQNAIFDAYQALNIELEEEAIFRHWLDTQLALGKLGNLPFAKREKFARVKWHAEKRPWVDPVKDANASEILLRNGMTSLRRVAAQLHNDPLEVILRESAEDMALAKSLGLNIDFGGGKSSAPPSAPEEEPEDDEEEDDDDATAPEAEDDPGAES